MTLAFGMLGAVFSYPPVFFPYLRILILFVGYLCFAGVLIKLLSVKTFAWSALFATSLSRVTTHSFPDMHVILAGFC